MLLLSVSQPESSAAAKKMTMQNYIVLGENIDEFVGEFNRFENALKLSWAPLEESALEVWQISRTRI